MLTSIEMKIKSNLKLDDFKFAFFYAKKLYHTLTTVYNIIKDNSLPKGKNLHGKLGIIEPQS